MNTRIYRHITLLLTALLLGIMLFPISKATGESRREAIIVSVPKEGWPPYIIVGDDPQQSSGIMLDVLRVATKSAGRDLVIKLFPERRSQLMIKEGTVDTLPKAKEWVDVPSDFLWTAPVVTSTDVLIYQASRTELKNQPIVGLDIGAVLGYSYPTLDPLFDQKEIRRHDATSTENLLNMLQHGHVDAAVTNRHVANWIIKNSKTLAPEDFVYGYAVGSAPYRFAFTRMWDNRTFISAFNEELARMRQDGRLEALLSKYQ